jgi:hypothetical protein
VAWLQAFAAALPALEPLAPGLTLESLLTAKELLTAVLQFHIINSAPLRAAEILQLVNANVRSWGCWRGHAPAGAALPTPDMPASQPRRASLLHRARRLTQAVLPPCCRLQGTQVTGGNQAAVPSLQGGLLFVTVNDGKVFVAGAGAGMGAGRDLGVLWSSRRPASVAHFSACQ